MSHFPMLWLWSNFFVLCSRLWGVSGAVRIILLLVSISPPRKGTLENISDRMDALLGGRLSFLFLAKRQPCLIRGFILYYYGKRFRLDVGLRFGCRQKDGVLQTHCWIVRDGVVLFERNGVIDKYVVLVEYR